MPLFWLAYRQEGVACVLILQASSLISARLKASLQIDGIDEHFAERILGSAGEEWVTDPVGTAGDEIELRRLEPLE
jgi:hypothetical protein